jgi:hypothetical protein
VPTRDDRDRIVDGLLRASASDALDPPSADCLDAETLAAWSEAALDGAAIETIVAHLSTCARCQAMAATLAQADPVAAVPARAAWGWRWMVPVAAVAAALALWILVPRSPAPAPVPERTMASNEPAATPVPPPATPSAEAPSGPTASPSMARPDAPSAPAVAPPVAPRARDESAKTSTTNRAQIQAQSGERSVAALAPSPVLIEFSAAPMVQQADTAASAAPAEGRREAESDRAASGTPAAAPEAAAAAPAPPVRWRILADGRVERSTTRGETWDAIAIGPALRITAGAAPVQAVCWLVGRAGVVLRTTDAQHFERVVFPETPDLVRVRAASAQDATVTTADGRAFTTADGGATWTEAARP